MSRWRECTLGDVLTLQRGFDITKAAQVEGPVPVVSSSGINSFHDTAMAEAPGVVIGRKGSLGTCFFLDRAFWPHDTTLWVKDFKGNDPKFCYYLLRGMDLAKHDVGAANPTLNRNHVHLLRVSAPDVDTQRRIASILGAYDDLIEVNRRRIAVLEEMARALFEEWFVRFRFPGHEGVSILDTPDGPLPEGWRWGTIGHLATTGGRSINPAAFSDEVFAHHSIPAFDDGRNPTMDEGDTIKSNKLEFQAPVILVSKLNPRFPRNWYIPNNSPQRQIASTEFVPLFPSGGSLAWLYAVVRSTEFTERLTAMAGGTSTSHQRVKPKDILNTPIAIPPGELLIKAERVFGPQFDMVCAAEAANRNLAASRDLLLPRLISGQLSVVGAERELEEAA